MYKLFVFAAVLACAAAAPGYLGYSSIAAPAVAYAGPAVAYSAPAYAYSAPAVAYSAPAVAAIPAPVAYTSGYTVTQHVEPVEQHGYKIVY